VGIMRTVYADFVRRLPIRCTHVRTYACTQITLARPAPATAADQRPKAPALHAVNNTKLVTVEFTASTR